MPDASVDAAETGDEAVAGGALLFHAEIDATVADEFVELFEGVFVEEEVDAFARGELAGFVFAFAAFGAASGFGERVAALEFGYFLGAIHKGGIIEGRGENGRCEMDEVRWTKVEGTKDYVSRRWVDIS